jgi:HlyD family secretion protein
VKKKAVIPLLVAIVVGAVIYNFARNELNNHSTIIHISGNIEVTEVDVSFKIPGRVTERLVDEGQIVHAAQRIATLETTDLAEQVALRHAELAAAQAVLAELEAGSRPEEIAAAQHGVDAAGAEYADAKSNYVRVKKLYEENTSTQQEFDSVQARFQAAEARLNQAIEQHKLVKEGPRKEQIDQARAQVRRAEAAVALAETTLGYADIVSPLNGMVLSKAVEPGEYVVPGTPVVTVANLHNVWLRAYINETDLGRVKLGQAANVTTDTYPAKIYPGRISFIASEAEFTPKNVQTQKERVKLVYRIKIDIDNPNMELKPGMPADAEILLEEPAK